MKANARQHNQWQFNTSGPDYPEFRSQQLVPVKIKGDPVL